MPQVLAEELRAPLLELEEEEDSGFGAGMLAKNSAFRAPSVL